MQKPIKFRGKAKSDGRWLYGSNQVSASEGSYSQGIFPMSDFWDLVDWGNIDPETVGQYIDRKDKDDKEIYQDDLFEVGFGSEPTEVNRVTYGPGSCSYVLLPHGLHLGVWASEGKVIGNIWDNPELLEGG